MNKKKSTLNRRHAILTSVSPKKDQHPFNELLDWLGDQGWAVNRIADITKKFNRSAISEQKKKVERGGIANLGFDIIHAIAKTAGISEQMIFDACLGRPFLKGRELQEARLHEILRKYQMIDPDKRTVHLEDAITMLGRLVDSTLDHQSPPHDGKAKIRRPRNSKSSPSQGE